MIVFIILITIIGFCNPVYCWERYESGKQIVVTHNHRTQSTFQKTSILKKHFTKHRIHSCALPGGTKSKRTLL